MATVLGSYREEAEELVRWREEVIALLLHGVDSDQIARLATYRTRYRTGVDETLTRQEIARLGFMRWRIERGDYGREV